MSEMEDLRNEEPGASRRKLENAVALALTFGPSVAGFLAALDKEGHRVVPKEPTAPMMGCLIGGIQGGSLPRDVYDCIIGCAPKYPES